MMRLVGASGTANMILLWGKWNHFSPREEQQRERVYACEPS